MNVLRELDIVGSELRRFLWDFQTDLLLPKDIDKQQGICMEVFGVGNRVGSTFLYFSRCGTAGATIFYTKSFAGYVNPTCTGGTTGSGTLIYRGPVSVPSG